MGGWVDKVGRKPTQPPTEDGAGVELGNFEILSETSDALKANLFWYDEICIASTNKTKDKVFHK